MAVRAIAASGEVVLNTETAATSALAIQVQVTVPKIDAGAGATVAVGTSIRFQTLSTGPIQILSNDKSRLIGVVPARSQAVIVARAGTVQAEADSWTFTVLPAVLSAFGVISAAYAQAEVTALRTCLIANGLMKAE